MGCIHRFTFLSHNFRLYFHVYFLLLFQERCSLQFRQFIEQQLRNLQLEVNVIWSSQTNCSKVALGTKIHLFLQLNRYYHSLATANSCSAVQPPLGFSLPNYKRVLQNPSAHMDGHRHEKLYTAAILLRFPSLWTSCWSVRQTSEKTTSFSLF